MGKFTQSRYRSSDYDGSRKSQYSHREPYHQTRREETRPRYRGEEDDQYYRSKSYQNNESSSSYYFDKSSSNRSYHNSNYRGSSSRTRTNSYKEERTYRQEDTTRRNHKRLNEKPEEEQRESSKTTTSPAQDIEYEVTLSDEEEIAKLGSTTNMQEKTKDKSNSSDSPTSSNNEEIIFDFRNSKRVIAMIQKLCIEKKLTKENNDFRSILKEKLISTILSQTREFLEDNTDEKFIRNFEQYMTRRMIYRTTNHAIQFFVKKTEVQKKKTKDETFFEFLEQLVLHFEWDSNGLHGVLLEPVQCLFFTNEGQKSYDFESAFMVIYTKKPNEKKSGFNFRFLMCRIEDGTLSFPGGKKLYKSESFDDCISRELNEELYGVNVHAASSIKRGPLCWMANNAIYAHEIQWKEAMKIQQKIESNYNKLKKDGAIMEYSINRVFDSSILESPTLDLDKVLEQIKKFKYAEEIVAFKWMNDDAVSQMDGNRSYFLKQVCRLFKTNIEKQLAEAEMKRAQKKPITKKEKMKKKQHKKKKK
ncbi:hypothetical protein C9374_010827 [Naegleria lovaniensis]|uniref:Nudix hydrolase domain-containing protein n=1 Tax=Naegleria lovaniensis TaxID=51637 RepID=A0AA88KIU3_NAELO|nr:uncharacterized protein C9374_010827 [Naegleria lovaniensis]KAG2374257.1 hypothetical protein C9374_010827 [Naegleria lovaniensis]